VTGVADAVHIATYYIGNILIQQQEAHGAVGLSYRQSRPPRAFNEGAGGGGPGPTYFPAPYPNHMMPPAAPAGPLQTQQIFIPNDLVGCIIGKGGSKINEIRQSSGSQIKIMEPGAVGVGVGGQTAGPPNEGERLVVITGQPQNIQLAVGMLYHVS
jgi:heterogeneous nuclear rnp K-like protein